jgi:NAD-dependent SIR2 family protein deacetylase
MLQGAALQRLRAAQRVLALTGAGISAESGVPTFRDAQTGLWAKYRAEELATPEAFLENPRFVWDWYVWRLARAERAAETAEIVLSIGTSSLVQPAAGLPLLAKRRGALLVEINPSPTPLTPHADVVLAGPAGQVLPQLLAELDENNGLGPSNG